ncbi:protein kinase [Rhodococcus sp. T2V]|uniref:protein kinase domain-containing protein n=1 Tax=Rhodococcus sp. T2V TaxID=3034164 RepID=UPI0023E09552|nr:protein kinase [Rhodococcus sp. T2V]MDF3312496.1 protein kinase [Rhodococcus sp. T2V]
MPDVDPFATQYDLPVSVTAELASIGFEDAHEIGRGGFGVVYRCTETSLDRTVAVKVLTADLDEQNQARFLREQRAAGQLTGHPYVVDVLQVGVTNHGRPFIVMPYYAHDSLEARIRRDGPLPLEAALQLGIKIASALDTAHRLGILHRDVKPGNILLSNYGEPALTDFGIAHIAGGFETSTGVVTGSPSYTAPEVISGEPSTAGADVYGLGATLFTALTGYAPFERRSGERLVAQFLRITSEPVPNPREHGIPEDVSVLIEGAMSNELRSRPTAAELAQQLRGSQLRLGVPVGSAASQPKPGVESKAKSRGGPMAPAAAEASGRGAFPTVTESRRPASPPLELTSFIDRREELAEAKNLLSTSRLVTLSGIGGVGKTRLGLRVAAKAHHDFPDGVSLVELGELRDESLLVDVVAAALGLRDRSARPVHEVLVDYLIPRKMLLVLDNCEQLVAAAAELVETLLRACPHVRILATSREPFSIGGEAVLTVPPLPLPDPDNLPRRLSRDDAMSLFVDRGATAVPGFELTDENKVTVARICRRLDGLPLPIELAAARLRAMAPEQILQRLTDRYALLTRGNRSAPTRQQTLRSCIDWSFELCTAREQMVWGQLSVFAGSFELEAAEWVCGTDPTHEELLDTVTSLVEKSILIREEHGSVVRFRMLETLRDYGRAILELTNEDTSSRRLHQTWYEALVLEAQDQWISPRQLDWVTRLEQELPNIRAALEFCVKNDSGAGLRTASALWLFWASQGLYNEGRRWLDDLLAQQSGPSTVDRIKALFVDSFLAGVQGDVPVARALVDQVRALADQATDPIVHAHLALADAYLTLFGENLSDARTSLKNAISVYTAQGDLLFQVIALGLLGILHDLQNDREEAIECLGHALAITEARGESVYRSYVLWALAVAVWRNGNRTKAIELLRRALQLDQLVNDPLNASVCLQVLAWITAEEHNARRAVVLMGAAEALSRSVGSPTVGVPGLHAHQDKCEIETRQSLGDRVFAASREDGAALAFDAAVTYALSEQIQPSSRPSGAPNRLTKREREVADLVAEGLTNREIAARLVISPRTAQGHVEHVLTKLGFTSRAQIAAWVVESKPARS